MKLIIKKEMQPNMEATYRVEKFDPKTKEKEQQHLELPTEANYRVEKHDPEVDETRRNTSNHINLQKVLR
ncbi:hypothetical protein HanHA300_Chr12g0460721 [Helianthus annuus]|nr:hypothetical protein HanHA300_Chr12g0460721 [Helianthus annuus]KAJ0506790.1 hypothetical protein HanHA89_Chr12g0486121 [Helianthus annuus]KAJ0676467.1 hypothetical protein HanLR1_Chr12g0463131 [Helianthus annuus]